MLNGEGSNLKKKKKKKKKFVSKSKEGWWATYSWRDRVGS